MTPGYVTGISGPLVTPVPGTGTHGYLPDLLEMRSSFFLIGRSLPQAERLASRQAPSNSAYFIHR